MPPSRSLVADVAGDGPAVLLLHGQPGAAGDWSRVAARLRDRYTVIAPDRLGYGRTGGAPGDFEANAVAALTLLDSLGIDSAIMAGHSWAGAVALRAARLAPERVDGLVLVASVAPGEPVGRLDRLLGRRPFGEVAAMATLGVAARALGVPALRRAAARVLPAGVSELVAQSRPDRGAWRAFIYEQRVYVQQIGAMVADLADIGAPTRVVTGSADHVIGPRAGRLLAAALPAAVFVEVPGAGHLLPWDHPEAVAAAVDALAAR